MSQLRAFESAARNMSVSRAAIELHLTQSAISRQIHQLEEMLGVALFSRIRQRIVLTEAGRIYSAQLRTCLESLSAATLGALTQGGAADVLNLAVLPTFATRWLIPRMTKFMANHPQLTVNFSTRTEPFDFEREPFDAAIHFGRGFWPNASCDVLLSESVVPVCSPAFKRTNRIQFPDHMAKQTLLQQSSRPNQWAEWFEQIKVDCTYPMRGPRYEQFSMLAQAAVCSQGVALLPELLIEDDLESKRLVVLFHEPLSTTNAYYVVVPDATAQKPAVIAFQQWITHTARGKKAAGQLSQARPSK
jgi:LysR family transcriptional regulator, glycine cleavage system transcriptional activator